MNIETFKKAGIYFSYCRYAVVPEIPRVQDVLYAMQLSDEQKNYDFCHGNHAIYIANVGLVIAAVGCRVLGRKYYDEAAARKIIAEAILEFCPPEAKCLFQFAFVEAQEIFVGQLAPSRSASRDEILKVCGCQQCRMIQQRADFNYEFKGQD